MSPFVSQICSRWSVVLLVIVTAGILSACASVHLQQFKGPNGNTAYLMQCSGWGRTLADCYRRAGEICPDGYRVVKQSSATAAVPAGGGVVAAPQYTLAVECK